MTKRSYVASGRMGALSVPAGLGIGLLAGAIGGLVYQKLIDVIPLIYVNVVLTCGLAVVVGLGTAYGLRIGKCRNALVGGMVGVVCGAATLAFTFHLAHQWGRAEMVEELDRLAGIEGPVPVEVLEYTRNLSFGDYIDIRVETGWWVGSSGGPQLTGPLVWLIWLVEAGIVCVGAFLFASTAAAALYCERCEVPTEDQVLGTVRAISPEAMRAAARRGSIQDCLDVEEGGGDIRFVWILHACPRCDQTTLISVHARWAERTGPKEAEEHDVAVIAGAVPTAEELAAVRVRFPPKRARRPRRRG